MTDCKIIPGWYTFSCKVEGENPIVRLRGRDTSFNLDVPVKAGEHSLCKRFYTEAAGYGYTLDYFVLETENCIVSEVLLEKMRPSRQASVYKNKKSYIDTISPFSNGELLEYNI